MEDYELPDIDRIVEVILDGLVKPGKIGPLKVETYDQYMTLLHGDEDLDLSEYDFIQINRRQGYLTDSFTDISGLDVQVWSKTRSRAVWIMDQVTKRLLASEYQTYSYENLHTGETLSFDIDFCIVLNGPDADRIDVMEETMVSKAFELHTRVMWKD